MCCHGKPLRCGWWQQVHVCGSIGDGVSSDVALSVWTGCQTGEVSFNKGLHDFSSSFAATMSMIFQQFAIINGRLNCLCMIHKFLLVRLLNTWLGTTWRFSNSQESTLSEPIH